MKLQQVLIVLFLISLNLACNFQRTEVDLIVHNGQIYTMNVSNQVVEAMAIKDGKIVELGPERQILNKYKAENQIDLAKKHVYPGFIDAHCHFSGYGEVLQDINLASATSWDETVQIIASNPVMNQVGWIKGKNWDQNNWPDKAYPSKSKLDELFPDTPVLLKRVDRHAAIVNQKALDLAGITRETMVEGGEILIQDGELQGVLIDNAVDLVEDIIPASRYEETLKKALMDAQRDCFAVGLTTVTDAGMDRREVEVIDSLQQLGELKMRIIGMLSDNEENMEYYLGTGPVLKDRFRVSSFKFYADGALGSRGACLLSAYSDMNGSKGLLLSNPDHFKLAARRLYDAGFQMNTHCIGDSANRLILDIYGEVLEGVNDKRWRIEHAQVVHKDDIPKFKEYSIIPSIQPTHATSDMHMAEFRLGRNRIRRAYAYEELRQQNGMVALGTDFPIEGISPINTFYAATVRKDANGLPADGFLPENKLSRENALKGITTWAAIAGFEEHTRGSLEPQKFADFVVVDRDLLTVPDAEMLNVKVLYTVVNGEVVFKRE